MGKTRHAGILAGLIGLAVSATAVAAGEDDLEVAVLAGSCASCHGTDGRSPGTIPTIAGRPEAVLARQLREFKAGETGDATVMTRLARGYTDEQIDQLARYFAGRGQQ